MVLETVESKGLAHLSYVLGDGGAGVAAVIDPRRDVGAYLDIARREGLRITRILETHIHADFVSGSRELAARTGAPIYVGRAEGYGFEHTPLDEGDVLEVGDLSLRVLHTPGHTPEHVCYLASGGRGASAPWGLFSGDTLFAGEVGRPDLLGEETRHRLAGQLYCSLQEKVLSLDDGVVVYPAHGHGSPCGGRIGDRTTTSIGYERRHNPKLQAASQAEFATAVLSGLPPAPTYYARMKRVNAEGPRVLGSLPVVEPMDPARFAEEAVEEGALVVDTRPPDAFAGGHIDGALHLGMQPDEFAIWAGWLLHPDRRLLLVVSGANDLDRVQRHLLRVGLDNVGGYLQGGMPRWFGAGRRFVALPLMSVHDLRERAAEGRARLQVVDVRRQDEWRRGRIPGAIHVPLPMLPAASQDFDRTRPTVVYCGAGYRASVGASLLQQRGFREVYTVPGGIEAWEASGYPLEPADAALQAA